VSKRIEIVIGGHGGQGVVLAGQILGKAAAFEGKMLCRRTRSLGVVTINLPRIGCLTRGRGRVLREA